MEEGNLISKIIDEGILLPPFFPKEETLDESNQDFPGEIKVTPEGKMLKKYIATRGLTGFLIDAYDDWVKNHLPQYIMSRAVTLNSTSRVRFSGVWWDGAHYIHEGKRTTLYPAKARADKMSYMLTVYGTLIQEEIDPNDPRRLIITREKYPVKIGSFPLMLGSSFCNLRDSEGKMHSPEVLAQLQEDPYDPFGYFVVQGGEKMLLIQEMMRLSMPFIMNIPKLGTVCRITVPIAKGTAIIQLALVGKTGKSKTIKLHLPSLGKKQKGRSGSSDVYRGINIFTILRLLSGGTIDQAIESIQTFVTKPLRKGKTFMELISTKTKAELTSDVRSYLIRKLRLTAQSPEIQNRAIEKIMEEDIFPNHVYNQETRSSAMRSKYDDLSMLISRYIEFLAGFRNIDDRNGWSTKRLLSAAPMMKGLFRMSFRSTFSQLQDDISKGSIKDFNGLVDKLGGLNIITDSFVSSFITSNWGAPGKPMKTNVSQPLKNANRLDKISHLQRVDVAVTRSGLVQIRELNGTSWGFICPSETPEGKSCGILKNLAVSVDISLEGSPDRIIEFINSVLRESTVLDSPLMINGIFRTWCNGKELRSKLIAARRNPRKYMFPKGTSITLDTDNVLHIYTDECRPIRYLVVLDENEDLVMDKLKLRGASFDVLENNGCIEYIDPFEQEFNCKIAYSVSVVDERKKSLQNIASDIDSTSGELEQAMHWDNQEEIEYLRSKLGSLQDVLGKMTEKRYTHCEISPQSILGISVALSPAPNHQQSPRNTYNAAMNKQAMKTEPLEHRGRFEKTKSMAYATNPLYDVDLAEETGIKKFPQGTTITLAMGSYFGFGREDAFVVNRDAIDLGKFVVIKYNVVIVKVKKGIDVTEELTYPQLGKGEDPAKYRSISPNGLPFIGARIEVGDYIVGKMKTIKSDSLRGPVKEIYNSSEKISVGEEGTVDEIRVFQDEEGLIVNIKLKIIRNYKTGDKLSPRYGQKGTFGLIVDPENLPFISLSGRAPDIIMNPHSFSSRMTCGLLIELLASTAASLSGVKINGSAFQKYDIDSFKATLAAYGFKRDGYQTFYSGITGQEVKIEIYTGLIYVQLLKHHVDDKINYRAEGPVKADTRQPYKGRRNGGGLKFGEMERDSIISHGAAAVLRERLCRASDPELVVVCENCGTMAENEAISNGYKCRSCGETSRFGQWMIPYSVKYMRDILSGLNVNITIPSAMGFKLGKASKQEYEIESDEEDEEENIETYEEYEEKVIAGDFGAE